MGMRFFKTARVWLMAAAMICLGPCSMGAPAQAHIYGTLMSDKNKAQDMHNIGVGYVTMTIRWDRFEPHDDQVDFAGYVNLALRPQIKAFKLAGMKIILDLGLHYPPSWVLQDIPNGRFKNQFLDEWNPTVDPDGKVIANGVFNNTVRLKQEDYINRVYAFLQGLESEPTFSGFSVNNDIYGVRLGWGVYGELAYPWTYFNGHGNCYWAYDAIAQGTASGLPAGVTVCPTPSWTPGHSSPNGEANTFLNWYLNSMLNYQNWQLRVVHTAFKQARLLPMYASWGIRPGEITAAVASNLNGSTSAEKSKTDPGGPAYGSPHGGQIQMGYDFDRYVRYLNDTYTDWVSVYTTSLGAALMASGDDAPTAPSQKWSPVHYLRDRITAKTGKVPQLFGENAGWGTSSTMTLCFQRMNTYNMSGLMWAFEYQLYDPAYASVANYASNIATYQ